MIVPRFDLLTRMGKSVSKRQAVAAALAANDEESARGRLLSAATHLFCKNGINATGIDAIIHEAGTAKTTLYKLFGSKTNLVHAVLESEGKAWREWFIGAMEEGGGDAQSKLTRIFPALKSWFGEERFYGCPFINAVAEHDKDAKQFRAIALKHKKVVLAHIEKLADEMGAAKPESPGPPTGAADRRRHRRRHGVARPRRRRHRRPRRRFPVRAVQGEEAEAGGWAGGAAGGGLNKVCG